jgi:predicted phage terminase large subunit-like protein
MPFPKATNKDGSLTRILLEQALRERQKRRLNSTTSFSEWLPQASPEFTWTFPHLQYVQKYIDKVTNGEIKRLMVFMPPQHGKSSQLTIRYPAYLLEKNPKKRIVVAAYGAELAEEFSGQIRSLVRARGLVQLDIEKQSVERWRTTGGGGLKAVGVGSPVTGFSADLIIIDDPVKNREEANSKAKRESTWKWYTDDLMTRQQANTPIILQMTRWHEDDLAGRLLERNPVGTPLEWHIVRLPALSEGTDPDDYPVKREPDEPLCPELHPYVQLMEFKDTMQSSFAALYQQRPTPAEGEVWKKAWFNEEGKPDTELRTVPKFPNNVKITQVWDTALEVKERNDFSAMVEGAMDEAGNIYVSAMVNEKLDFPTLARRMRNEYERISGGDLCVEDKASGKPARQQLKREGIPVIEIPAGTSDKEARAKSVTQYAEGGKIYFVMQQGNVNDILIQQLVTFPNGKHDDLHDAFVHLLRRLTSKASRWSKQDIKKLMTSMVTEETMMDVVEEEEKENNVWIPHFNLGT